MQNIQVVSFIIEGHPSYTGLPKNREKIFIETINKSKADLIVFPGWTLNIKDIKKTVSKLTNKSTTIIFENFSPHKYRSGNEMHIIENGNLLNTDMRQVFTEASEVNNNKSLVGEYVKELATKRSFNLNKNKCLILSCGENNILKNKQSDGNKVVFRLNNKSIENEFETILENTSFVINPIHTPMGNQGKISKRREYFSNDNRVYISTNNVLKKTSKSSHKLLTRKLIYVYKNSLEIPYIEQQINEKEDYVINTYIL
tara:strand:+ start:476 stop:1246 length:771 start_codon:yes stop_codon:yes gene_type:complete